VNGPVVLVVDDSPTVRAIVQRTLQREHLQVVTAADGLSALTAGADTSPDLVLLDVMLPRMDGYQICHLLRQHREFRDTPILLLSGKDGVFDRLHGRVAGATAYISKPFDPAELVSLVKRYLSTPRTRE
jgi:twitching motility two-component system response regulator PilG